MNTHRQFIWGTKTYVMGVINVTPDSFSDGGQYQKVSEEVKIFFINLIVKIVILVFQLELL